LLQSEQGIPAAPQPRAKGFDMRTFECAKCEHIHTVTIAIDPMKSDGKVGWLVAGEEVG
jgi:hypothetical protein